VSPVSKPQVLNRVIGGVVALLLADVDAVELALVLAVVDCVVLAVVDWVVLAVVLCVVLAVVDCVVLCVVLADVVGGSTNGVTTNVSSVSKRKVFVAPWFEFLKTNRRTRRSPAAGLVHVVEENV
jgi:hypothetical protein